MSLKPGKSLEAAANPPGLPASHQVLRPVGAECRPQNNQTLPVFGNRSSAAGATTKLRTKRDSIKKQIGLKMRTYEPMQELNRSLDQNENLSRIVSNLPFDALDVL